MDKIQIKNYNIGLVLCIIALNVVGVLAIRSATNADPYYVDRQVVGVCAGIVVMGIISFVPYRTVLRFGLVIYAACLALLAMVLVYGLIRGGARRWVVLPVLGQLQPSEFVKIGLIVYLSDYLGRNAERINLVPRVLIGAVMIAALPLILIMLEPDTSTTIVIGVVVVAVLFVSGISYKLVGITMAGAAVLIGGVLLLLKNGLLAFLDRYYQVARILAWFDRAGHADTNLQQNNSIMAIASGQLTGKGLNTNVLASVKNGNFLAAERTDFIFAVIGEELGFIGCTAVILLFAVIVLLCLRAARKAADMEGRLLCTGVGVLLSFQSFTNIAVATGIFPNTGLPLPFISYGVSSLLSFYIGMGLVLNVGLLRDKPPSRRLL